MKRIAIKYRNAVAALLLGWVLLCGLMPVLSLQAGDGGMTHAAHHQMDMQMDMSGHHGDHASGASDSHCCDALQGEQLPVSYPFMDLFSFVLVGSLLMLLAAVFPAPPRPVYVPVPHSGPPLHKRHCVWLD